MLVRRAPIFSEIGLGYLSLIVSPFVDISFVWVGVWLSGEAAPDGGKHYDEHKGQEDDVMEVLCLVDGVDGLENGCIFKEAEERPIEITGEDKGK